MRKSILLPIVTILVAALLLFVLCSATSAIRESNAAAERNQTMLILLPGSTGFEEEAYSGEDTNIRRVYKAENGYVVEVCVAGYVDGITMLVGVSNEGSVTGLRVCSLSETHTLGREALTDWRFLKQFLKTTGDADVGSNVDALTGATVTSKAIARGVNSAVGYVTGSDVSSGATSWGG